MKKLNVILAAHHYPVTAAAEYMYRALKRRDDVNVLSVGPDWKSFIPWNEGLHLKKEYIWKPDIPLSTNLQTAPITYIETKLPRGFVPDLWLDVNAGFGLSGRPKNGIRALWETDPHVLKGLYNFGVDQYNYVFCPQTEYSLKGEIYLPFGFDPIWHSPIVPSLEKKFDVALLGNVYPNRVELMGRLKDIGLRTFFELGPSKEDARKIYNSSICGVNWSSMMDLTARVFELMGIGILAVCNRIPDLDDLFEEDKHYVGFSTMDEAITKINDIAKNPEKYEHIAKAGHEEVIRSKHSWDDRVQMLLEICGLVDKS